MVIGNRLPACKMTEVRTGNYNWSGLTVVMSTVVVVFLEEPLLFLPSFFFLMRTSPSTYLLSRVQSCVCPLLCCGTLEEGVRDRSVAVRTDVGVALLLIPGIPHFWDAVPLIV